MSFAVPPSMIAGEDTRAWLQLGSMVVPLPVPVEVGEQSAAAAPGPAADEETLAMRRLRAAELAAEAATRRLAEAQATVEALDERLVELEGELERERERTADRERIARASAQREHAERALRQELEERLARIESQPEPEDHTERIAELEREVLELRRGLDEAEQEARAAQAARRRAELALEELPAPGVGIDTSALSREFRTADIVQPASAREARSLAALAADRERLRAERQLADARAAPHEQTEAALRLELEARARSEAQLRAELAGLRARTTNEPGPDAALAAMLAELRSELAHLRVALEAERAERQLAESRVARAYEAIQEVRDELDRIRTHGLRPPTSGPANVVEAERLTQALARLRASTPESPGPPVRAAWLADALRTLARTDPEATAQLLAAMLPASAAEAKLARRLLAAGAVRRRIRRGGARIRGRSHVAARLDELMSSEPRFAELRIEPRSVLMLAGAMINPEWTRGERFTIAHDAGPFLHIRDADRPLVSDAAIGPIAATVLCGPGLLASVLSGQRPPGTEIQGRERELELVRKWLERAQSG
jgi:hypothetical protein